MGYAFVCKKHLNAKEHNRGANKYFLENPTFFVKITAYYQPPKSEKYIIFQPIKKILCKKPAHIFVKYIRNIYLKNCL